jgi:hypothetical protein
MSITTFCFTSTIEAAFIKNITPDIILRIEQTSNSIACLYFTDGTNNKINIPENIVIYTYDYQTKERVILKPLDVKNYILCWTDNYDVKMNNEVLWLIRNRRRWDIS